jgi:hypothetical protein
MTDADIRRHIELMRAIDKPTVHLPIAVVERLMSTGHRVKVGRVDEKKLAKGKIQPKPSHMSVPKKVAAKAKADRKEAGLRANRKGKA